MIPALERLHLGRAAQRSSCGRLAMPGFYVQILQRDEKPWQTVEGIEFRSVTISAYKGKEFHAITEVSQCCG